MADKAVRWMKRKKRKNGTSKTGKQDFVWSKGERGIRETVR